MNSESYERSPRGTRRERAAASGRLIAAAALGALLALFAVLNSQSVTVHWIFTTSQMPLIVVIVLCTAVGGLLGWVVGIRRRARR